jgi:hypothetical protein
MSRLFVVGVPPLFKYLWEESLTGWTIITIYNIYFLRIGWYKVIAPKKYLLSTPSLTDVDTQRFLVFCATLIGNRHVAVFIVKF